MSYQAHYYKKQRVSRQGIVLLLLGILMFQGGLLDFLPILEHNTGDSHTSESDVSLPQTATSWVVNGQTVIGNWTTANSTYDWVSGQGTEQQPFLIENVTFDGA